MMFMCYYWYWCILSIRSFVVWSMFCRLTKVHLVLCPMQMLQRCILHSFSDFLKAICHALPCQCKDSSRISRAEGCKPSRQHHIIPSVVLAFCRLFIVKSKSCKHSCDGQNASPLSRLYSCQYSYNQCWENISH